METGRFRRDLFYRLNVYAISLPPLRERGDDLPLLIEHFLKRFRKEMKKDALRLAPDTLELLRAYAWPGNLRELQSVLKYALLEATGPVIVPEFLPGPVRRQSSIQTPSKSEATQSTAPWEAFLRERLNADDTDLYARWQALTDRILFEQVLEHVQGNVSRAARILGIHRGTLRTKLDALGISSAYGSNAHSDGPGDGAGVP